MNAADLTPSHHKRSNVQIEVCKPRSGAKLVWLITGLGVLVTCSATLIAGLPRSSSRWAERLLESPQHPSSKHSEMLPCDTNDPLWSRLTATDWRRVTPEHHPSAESFALSLKSDGTFQWTIFSDYTDNRVGRWACRSTDGDGGVLFMTLRRDSPFERSNNVFPFRFTADGGLKLGRYQLARAPRASSMLFDPGGIPMLISEEEFSSYFRLTSHVWLRLDGTDVHFVPERLTLRTDGTLQATYRNSSCTHGGFWSLEGNRIFMELPADHCDVRGYTQAAIRGHMYSIDGSSLTLDNRYVFRTTEQ